MLVGERVRVDGGSGTIVAVLEQHAFAEGYPAHEWAYLGTGILVLNDQAGLIHYPDLDKIRIDLTGD